MANRYSATIPSAKSNITTTLEYVEGSHPKHQARLVGRNVLIPDLDLASFRCVAVIDWLVVEVRLSRPTQFRYIQESIVEAIERKCWIEQLDAAGMLFRIRFQEPNMTAVAAALIQLETSYKLISPPAISGMEVSVDFTPEVPSEELRRKLFGLLVRHHFPGKGVLLHKWSRPRSAWGSVRSTRFVSPWNHRRWNEGDVPAPSDGTFYVGGKIIGPMWRIMDKIIDNQNIAAKTFRVLEEHERRIRIEVTFNDDELAKLGIETVGDLERFRFTTLQRAYFRFMLPTFSDLTVPVAGVARSIRRCLERERRTKFLTTGVLGLEAMDEHLAREKKRLRKALVARFKKEKRLVQPERRVGAGPTGCLLAFDELNARIETALRHLGERVR